MAEQTPFFWGAAGTRLTPEEILAQRKAAQLMGAEASSTAPVGHWSAGLNRVVQGLMSGYDGYTADQASKQNGTESTAVIQALLGGGTPAAVTPVTAPAATAPISRPMGITSIPTGDNAAMIRAGLLERGLPEHVADGFLMNFKDESGLNPGINEAKPLVPGSRGGFGLAQWTGPRRVGLEQYAAAKGTPVSDVNLQLDYLSNELKGPEAAAAQSIMATNTPGDAAAAIAKSFLRPAPENLERRVAQYTGGAATPNAVAPAAKPSINPLIAQAMTSPYMSDSAKSIGKMLFQNQLEQQQKANDPLRQLQIQEAQGKIAAMPLDLRGKQLSNTKAEAELGAIPLDLRGKQLANAKVERELQGEGAMPLSRDERNSYGIPEGQPAYKTRSGEIKFGPAGTKITNVNGDAETSFSKEAGKATAGRFNDLVNDGQKSKQMMSDMTTLLDLGKGIGTGKSAQLKAVLGPYAQAAGIDVTGLPDIQAYEAIVNRVAPLLRVAGSGAQSDYELKNFLKSIPSLGNTQEGNELATAVMTGLTQNKIQASEIASKALAGEITRTEAEKQLRDLPDPMRPYTEYKQRKSNVDDLLKKYGTK